MLESLEIAIGVVVGLSAIAAIFWFTFRNPPSRRTDDTTFTNANAEYLAQHIRGEGHGPF